MDKLKEDDGFTLIEVVFVLMLLSVLSLLTIFHSPQQGRLVHFMHTLEKQYLKAQFSAVKSQLIYNFEVTNHHFIINENMQAIPPSISCDSQQFLIYPSGKVNHAGTVTCYSGNHEMNLVIQLGSGYASIR